MHLRTLKLNPELPLSCITTAHSLGLILGLGSPTVKDEVSPVR